MNDQRLEVPGIFLALSGILGLIEIPFLVVPGLFILPFMGDDPTAPAWWPVLAVAGFIAYLTIFGLLPLIMSPMAIIAAWNMLRGRRLALVRTVAVLCMIPGISPFALTSVPTGIWLFILLKDPSIIARFGSAADAASLNKTMAE